MYGTRSYPTFSILAAAVSASLSYSSVSVSAQVSDQFFKGKQINFIIGYEPGGGYDIYGRLVASHLSRHIPGNPTIVPQNMQGISSLKATNYLHSQAARDGTVIGLVSSSIAFDQATKHQAVQFDARNFSWVGRMTPAYHLVVTWHTSDVRTIEAAKKQEVILAGDNPRGVVATVPRLLNRMVGTRFKVIPGYPGTAGALLAVERGEVHGATLSQEALTVNRAEWVAEKKVSILVGSTMRRTKEFPDVPALGELGDTEDQRKILQLYSSTADLGRSILAPPGVPERQLATLRAAFDAMMASPEFRADAAKRMLNADPMTGQQVADLIRNALQISPELAEQATNAVAP